MKKNIFDDFTNLYSLTKTLKFELKPTPETKSITEIVKEDNEIDRLYNEEMKPMFNKLHEKFINDSLGNTELSVKNLNSLEKRLNFLKKLKETKSDKNQISKLEGPEGEIAKTQKELREEIVKSFQDTGKKWKNVIYKDLKLKDEGYKILTEKDSLEILKIENPDKKDIIEKFKGFFTYFTGLNQNRENYYSAEDKSISVANRTINENLVRFINNRRKFQSILPIISDLKKFEESLSLENYKRYLTQEGIEKFNKEIVGEINKEINLFSQQSKKDLPKNSKFEFLYKQIGFGRSTFEILTIEEEEEWQKLEEMQNSKKGKEDKSQNDLVKNIEKLYKDFFVNTERYDLDKIYFNKTSINTISNFWFINWHILSELLASKKIIKNKNKDKEYIIPKKISLSEIKEAIESETDIENLFKKGKIDQKESSTEHPRGEYEKLFQENGWKTFLKIWKHELEKNLQELREAQTEFNLRKNNPFNRNIDTELVKRICDSFLSIERMVKYHKVDEIEEKDGAFYLVIDEYIQKTELNKYYNAFRNHLTKKAFNKNKIKLNFRNGSLLGGFSDGQERNKGAVILRNKDRYYLGILQNRNFFRTDKENNLYTEHSDWSRLMLANLKFNTLAGKGFLGKYGERYGDLGKREPMQAVNYLQNFISTTNYIKKYPALKKVLEKKYNNKQDFDRDVRNALQDCFNMHFKNIDGKILEDGIRNDKLYLFEITNKDLRSRNKNHKNIHSIYFLDMFSEKNLTAPQIALNGGGEIFFRKGQKDKLNKKKDKKGKEVFDAKRYSEDKTFLHIPITINYGKPKKIKFKKLINESLKNNDQDIKILGIDRGEKNLLYYSLINHKGEMIQQGSLNKIELEKKEIDYNALLSRKAEEMMEARKSWETIGKIADLKKGYLSQAVHEIYKLAIENNAIIVLEDLNSEFKANRTAKVEKAVYKKFELALARKLNHLILKNKKPEETGGTLNAYQLTPEVAAGDVGKFEKSKQWGIIFYTRPNYTSITDPITGWRKTIYIANSDSNLSEKWKKAGVVISYDKNKKCYKFHYEKWELYAFKEIERMNWSKREKNPEGGFGNTRKYKLHQEFEKLFKDFDKEKNINQQMTEDKGFDWKSFIFLWNLLNQIRNSDRSKDSNESDFIQSPVWSEAIQDFYDSRKSETYKIKLPENGDANGAYNIARKGIMILNRIKDNPEKPDLYIKDTDWSEFAQNSNQ